MSDGAHAVIADIMTAISNCALYEKSHPSVSLLSERVVDRIGPLFLEDSLSFTILGDTLYLNDAPLPPRSSHIHAFIRRLKRKGIGKVAIRRGVTPGEMQEFIGQIALADAVSDKYPHIAAGVLEVRSDSGTGDTGVAMRENVEKVTEVYHGVSRFKKLDIVGLEDVVMNFLSTMKREANILNLLCPVKTYSEYTYTHNTNVAVLSVFQAEGLGLSGDVLRDIGLAGLLHDIGKMSVPREIIEKETSLDEREWTEVKMHPVRGALQLAQMADCPKLALFAALEHHMRFDGTGYPDTKKRGRKQHLVSQIIAISDFYDALRTERAYRASQAPQAIIGMMLESSGRLFNPLLVGNFIAAMRKSGVVNW